MVDVDKLVEALQINLVEYLTRYTGRCPIHKGDNDHAFSIYKNSGVWQCFSHGCHEKYGKGANGLVKGMLGCTDEEAIAFLEDFNVDSIKFDNINYAYLSKVSNKISKVKREHIRHKLEIPAPYFIKRGFTPEILDKYDVGFCKNKDSQFANRCVVPVYDQDYKSVIGYSGRDVTDKNKPKWLHSKFERNSTLYNIWFAKKFIQENNTAILTESAGNIWRLEEAGIHNSLAIFGTQLGFNQMRILSQLGVINLVLLLDNDVAGKEATSTIVKRLKGLYNIVIPKIEYGDVGECPVNYLQDKIMPVLSEL